MKRDASYRADQFTDKTNLYPCASNTLVVKNANFLRAFEEFFQSPLDLWQIVSFYFVVWRKLGPV